MSEVILVNHQVKFEPDCYALTSMDNPRHTVVLPVAAARCFSILLAQRGEIVTIKQFQDLVWNPKKIIVSDNTVYQAISTIRKALVRVGGSKHIIETQTRRGWSIPDTIHVYIKTINERVPENNEQDGTTHNTNLPDITIQDNDVTITGDNTRLSNKIYQLIFLVVLLMAVIAIVSYVNF